MCTLWWSDFSFCGKSREEEMLAVLCLVTLPTQREQGDTSLGSLLGFTAGAVTVFRQDTMTGMQVCGRQSVSGREALDSGGDPEFLMFQRTSEESKDLGVTEGHIILKVGLYKAIKCGVDRFYIYGLIILKKTQQN